MGAIVAHKLPRGVQTRLFVSNRWVNAKNANDHQREGARTSGVTD
jgi:hypothetical protein